MTSLVFRMGLESVVGRNIRRIRLSRGASQETLAFEVGIAVRHLGRIERGSISATIGVIERIAAALGCAVSELVEDNGDAPMPSNLPRGKHAIKNPATVATDREKAASRRREDSKPGSNGQGPEHETLGAILKTGISGMNTAAAERMISEIIVEAGGESKLTATQRRRIELARVWALTKDIDE